MRIIFFGLGSIGLRHLRLIQEFFNHEIFAYRSHWHEYDSSELTPSGVHELNSWNLIDIYQPEIAFICNSTNLHIQTAIECAKRKMHLFIEKPIGTNLNGLDELLYLVRKYNLVTYVAYDMRHATQINIIREKIKDIIIDKINIVCHSNSQNWPSKRNLDNVLLELSHEIDYAYYIFRYVDHIQGVHRDTWAKIELSRPFGCPIDIDLDMLAKDERRYIYLHGYTIELFTNKLLSRKSIWQDMKVNDSVYLNQLHYFFDNINNPKMMNNIFEASEIFKMIMDFKNNAV